jgi:hypothetical protein
MRKWIILGSWLVVASACGPTWPKASFGRQNLCGELTRNDHIVKAELVSIGQPVQMKVSLWPDEPPYWHTPLTMRVVDRWRGDATGDFQVFTPYPVDGTVWGFSLKRPDGSAYPTWSFLRFVDGHYWLGGAELGVLGDDGTLTFPNATHQTEKAFLDELDADAVLPECAMNLPSRLDGK